MKIKHTHIHLFFTITWILLVVPTVLYWSTSILWVLLISLWANIASHWGAWEASKAKETTESK